MLNQNTFPMQVINGSDVVSMTSIDVSALTGSRHDKVRLSIERLAKSGVIQLPPMGEVDNNQSLSPNRKTKVYVFSGEKGKRDSIIVVAQLCPEFTARLVDRWQELEQGLALSIPQSLPDALRFAADLAEQKAIADQKLLEAAPKVQFFDAVVARTTLMTATQVGQKLGLSAIKLNQALESFDVYNGGVKRGRVFKQWFIDAGHGELKQTEQGFSQPLFTPSGEAWVVERLISEGYEVKGGGK